MADPASKPDKPVQTMDPLKQLEQEDLQKLRSDMDEGLRFLHTMTMQTKSVVIDTATKVTALIQQLIADGKVASDTLNARFRELKPQADERDQQLFHIRVGESIDKYKVADLPDIDCASIIPICKARCCKLTVFLSFQDLDEGRLKWDYGAPYVMRRRSDGYCVHNDTETKGCTAYHERPVVCRSFDCREDKRIWVDFEKRILAPEEP
jgi:hypothetical protein